VRDDLLSRIGSARLNVEELTDNAMGIRAVGEFMDSEGHRV
jgi:hypothetical protein